MNHDAEKAKHTPVARPKSALGPKPNVLKLKGKWQDAVRQSPEKEEAARGLAEVGARREKAVN